MSSSARPDWDAWRNGALSRVNSQRTALAIIDLQRDFCSDDGALAALGSDVSPARAAAHRIERFLPAVREALPVIAFFRLVYDPVHLSAVQKERLLRNGRPVICAPDGPGSELFISPAPADRVFTKHRYSAFSNDEFCQVLKKLSIDTIAVAGVDTHICVEGTIRQGYDLGYRMLVLSDLVATRKSELARHDHSLAVCERYFGLVITSDHLLELFAHRGPALPSTPRP